MADYTLLSQQMQAFGEDCAYPLTLLSNAAALLWEALDQINWAGFYLVDHDSLRLGPLQGKPACMSIQIGKGVCGTAICRRETIVVPDVHAFPGHIACDSASRSEIVIPLFDGDRLAGVLDIDSPILNRFSEEDREGLEAFARTLTSCADWRLKLL